MHVTIWTHAFVRHPPFSRFVEEEASRSQSPNCIVIRHSHPSTKHLHSHRISTVSMSTTASHQPYLYSLPSRARNEKLDTSITTCMWVLTTRSVVLHSLTMPAHLACQPHMHCRPILLERDCIAAVGNLQILEWHRGFMHREIEVSTSSVQTFSIQVDVVSPLSSPAIYWQSPYINRMRFQASVADEVRYRSIVFSLTLHWWWVVRRS